MCPFSTFPLTRSTFFAFSRLFAYCFPSKKIFFGFSLLPCLCLCLCLLSVFYFILFFIFFVLPQPKPLLPFPQPTPPNPSALHYSLWPNPPSQTRLFSSSFDWTHDHKPKHSLLDRTHNHRPNCLSSSSDRTIFLSLTELKNPILKPIFSSQNRRFKGGD